MTVTAGSLAIGVMDVIGVTGGFGLAVIVTVCVGILCSEEVAEVGGVVGGVVGCSSALLVRDAITRGSSKGRTDDRRSREHSRRYSCR